MPDDDLLSDEELAEAQRDAAEILAKPVAEHSYRDPNYRGGPRNLTEDELLAAALELATRRMIVQELETRLREAKIFQYEGIIEHMDVGVPIAHIAEYAGFGQNRSSVYRIPDALEKLKKQRPEEQREPFADRTP